MIALLMSLVILAVVVALPLLIVVGLLRLVFEAVLLPLRLLGVAVQAAFAGLGFFLKVFVGGIGLLVGLVLVPLLPLIVVALAVWALVRILEPPRVPVRSRS